MAYMFEDVHVHPLEARGQFPVSSTEIVSIIFETGSFLSLELISQALAKGKEPQGFSHLHLLVIRITGMPGLCLSVLGLIV